MGVKVYSNEVLSREPKLGKISVEQGMKVKNTKPRFFKHKDGTGSGSVFPRKRKLVKKMILESIVKSLSSLFLSPASSLSFNTEMSDNSK